MKDKIEFTKEMAIKTREGDTVIVKSLVDTIAELTKELEALKNQWISVEDRLPDEDGRYMCYVKKLERGDLDVYMRLLFLDGKWPWIENKDRDIYNKVTHWMPLPEPPEVK